MCPPARIGSQSFAQTPHVEAFGFTLVSHVTFASTGVLNDKMSADWLPTAVESVSWTASPQTP